jgi:hypothetical protein
MKMSEAAHVYVVEEGDYEQRCVVGVFSSRELALASWGSDITVYRLDGGEVTAPTWWHVSCNLQSLEWVAQTYRDASELKESVASIATWPAFRNNHGYPDGRLDIRIFTTNADEAIRLAKTAVLGKTVPVSSCTGPSVQHMWQPAGERKIESV